MHIPTQNTNSQEEYSECFDLIYDIIIKYQVEFQMVLFGDLNGTILSNKNNKHDLFH